MCGLLGPCVQMTNKDLWSSAIEMVLLFSKKISAALVVVEQSKGAKRFSNLKFNIQPLTMKVTLMERFTDAFLDTFSVGVNAGSLTSIKKRIYKTHFLASSPNEVFHRKLKRMESIITGAADLELKSFLKTPAKNVDVNLDFHTTQEPQLRTFQTEVKDGLRSPKNKRHHVVTPPIQSAPRSPKTASLATLRSSIQELRAVTSSLKIKNRTWLKSPSTSLTDLYQEAKNRRRRLEIDKSSTGVSLKISRDSYKPVMITGSHSSTKSLDLPSLRRNK